MKRFAPSNIKRFKTSQIHPVTQTAQPDVASTQKALEEESQFKNKVNIFLDKIINGARKGISPDENSDANNYLINELAPLLTLQRQEFLNKKLVETENQGYEISSKFKQNISNLSKLNYPGAAEDQKDINKKNELFDSIYSHFKGMFQFFTVIGLASLIPIVSKVFSSKTFIFTMGISSLVTINAKAEELNDLIKRSEKGEKIENYNYEVFVRILDQLLEVFNIISLYVPAIIPALMIVQSVRAVATPENATSLGYLWEGYGSKEFLQAMEKSNQMESTFLKVDSLLYEDTPEVNQRLTGLYSLYQNATDSAEKQKYLSAIAYYFIGVQLSDTNGKTFKIYYNSTNEKIKLQSINPQFLTLDELLNAPKRKKRLIHLKMLTDNKKYIDIYLDYLPSTLKTPEFKITDFVNTPLSQKAEQIITNYAKLNPNKPIIWTDFTKYLDNNIEFQNYKKSANPEYIELATLINTGVKLHNNNIKDKQGKPVRRFTPEIRKKREEEYAFRAKVDEYKRNRLIASQSGRAPYKKMMEVYQAIKKGKLNLVDWTNWSPVGKQAILEKANQLVEQTAPSDDFIF